MGAALDPLRVLGEHQGAPRLLDRALRRARADDRPGRAHPRSPRRDARGGRGRHGARPRARRDLRRSTTPSPAARTCPTSRSSRAPPSASRSPRAPRGRRRHGAGEPAGRARRELYQEGVVIPPVRLDDEVLDRARSPTCATPTSAAATCGRSSRRTGSPSGASPSSCERRGARRVERRWTSSTRYSERVVRAAIAALPDGRYEAEDVLEPVEGELEIRAAVTIAGDEIEIDFAGHVAAARREPQLPARRHALGLLLRRPLPDRPGPARLGRRLRAGHGRRARGLARQRAASRRGRRREHGDVEPHRRRRLRRVRPGGPRARAGPGDDEQRRRSATAGSRTTRRSAAARARARTPTGPSAVHVAMSNTLNTPVEALELAYPLRVERYALRLGSGGAGGTVAATASSASCACSSTAGSRSLGDRRRHAPRGAHGGGGRRAGAEPPERRGAPPPR